jgi:hypothetical protein
MTFSSTLDRRSSAVARQGERKEKVFALGMEADLMRPEE